MQDNRKMGNRNMQSRINLQTIGSNIYKDLDISSMDYSNFSEREHKSDEKIQNALNEICGEDKANKLMEEINKYVSTKFQITFSLGMKTGAMLQLKLINNFETDI